MMIYNRVLLHLIIFCCFNASSFAWDDDDLEVFDVVEEVNRNFYEVLGVAQDASGSEIKSAYRTLTLKLHPDKSDAPDAEVQFRNLVSIYNILKDPGKREKYNEVLVNGLPNWRSAIYYYRHVRKMGLAEMSIILFIIISIGQYIVGWAAYVEKRFTAESVLGSRLKKLQKKSVANVPDLDSVLNAIPRPSVKNTLPFQIVRGVYTAIVSIPALFHYAKEAARKRREEKLKREKWEEEEKDRLQREADELAEIEAYRKAGKLRKRRGFIPQERDCLLDPVDEPENTADFSNLNTAQTKPPVITGGLWTDDDLVELVRLVKKYPGGTTDRWEKIAEFMNRSVTEVTHMAAKMKDNCYKVPEAEEPLYVPPPEPPKKTKTRGGKLGAATETGSGATVATEALAWSQIQQKALETALAKNPKGPSDRWDKIAKCVPNKTKEECMLRYKYLAEMIKKQKHKEDEEKPEKTNEDNVSSVKVNDTKPSNEQSAREPPEDLDGV